LSTGEERKREGVLLFREAASAKRKKKSLPHIREQGRLELTEGRWVIPMNFFYEGGI